MSKVSELHREWSKDPEYREAYDRLEPEFTLPRMLIEARTRAALTQAELAERMETTQSVVARLESGRIHPSTRTLEKIARARAPGFGSVSIRHDAAPRTPGRGNSLNAGRFKLGYFRAKRSSESYG